MESLIMLGLFIAIVASLQKTKKRSNYYKTRSHDLYSHTIKPHGPIPDKLQVAMNRAQRTNNEEIVGINSSTGLSKHGIIERPYLLRG